MALSKIIENSLADEAVSSAKLKDFSAAVDLNGVELVLDADADTSITADTDDRIDFKIAGVEHFSFSNSSGDTIIKPMVDAKDIKFQQYDGRTLLDINDGGFVGIANGATSSGEIRFFEDTDNGSNYVGLNAGSISSSFTLTLPTADGSSGQFLKTDGSGALSFDTVSSAADDLTTGDAAVTLATSAGNITIDAQGNDTDIIFKGTDGSSDTTFLTIDGSAAGEATFNAGIVIADAGNIGSASDKDAIAISSAGVVTMNQIPVFSAGINVSGGSIAGTLSTAAQANITSLGTLTALTVDDVAVDGKVITMTGSSSDTAVFTAGTNGTLSIVTTDDSAAAANITITADGTAELAGTTVTLNSGGDIVLDADGADLKFADGGTDLLSITNSSSDVVFKPLVDAKDIIIHQYDGTSLVEFNDGGYSSFTSAALNPEQTLTDASTISWNALTQPVAKVTLGANRTIGAASGGVAGQFVSLLVIQDGTGSRTVSWNAAYEFASDTAPTLTTTANLGDLFVFRYNGSKWLEVGRNLALTLS